MALSCVPTATLASDVEKVKAEEHGRLARPHKWTCWPIGSTARASWCIGRTIAIEIAISLSICTQPGPRAPGKQGLSKIPACHNWQRRMPYVHESLTWAV